ncbi:MAG: hypothetical protein FWD06_08145 [Oscillospiraceae bacterium]|nr:hypothetical protein [Oscillospiraceae bacterium]
MKTLLIYHSNRPAVCAMCEAAANDDVDVHQLRVRYKKRPLSDYYRAMVGRGIRLAPLDIDFSKYNHIILVDSLKLLAPSAQCNEFLYRCDLTGHAVTCIVSNKMKFFGRARAVLQRRVRLAGGHCRDVVCLAHSELVAHPASYFCASRAHIPAPAPATPTFHLQGMP